MTRSQTPTGISASDVGDYVYCARAYGLRRVTDQAADPVAAARAGQQAPAGWQPGLAVWQRRRHQRAGRLAAGRQAHHWHHRRVTLTTWLAAAGILCLAAALVSLTLTLAATPAG